MIDQSAFMTAGEVARVLGVHPQTVRDQAHTDPRALGFPVIVVGSRVLIPRKPFINFIKGGATHDEGKTE